MRLEGTLYQLGWVFYLALAIAGVVWVGVREGTIPLGLFVDPEVWWLDLGLGLGAGFVLVGLWEGTRRLLPGALSLEDHLTALLHGVDGTEVLALAVLSGFAEELFFRGAVQGSWGLIPATLLFALLHTGPDPAFRLWTLFAAIAGLALGGLMLWRGNLLGPAVAHFLVNAINLRRLAARPLPEGPPDTGPEG